MNSQQLYDLYSLCLPHRPSEIVRNFVLELVEAQRSKEPESLFLKACRANIDLYLKNETVKKQVVEHFMNVPPRHLNCEFLRSHLHLFSEVLQRKLELSDKKTTCFGLGVFKNQFIVHLNENAVMEVNTLEEYPTHWPFILTRIAFLSQLGTINYFVDEGPDEVDGEMVRLRIDSFLALFDRRILTKEESQNRCSYRMRHIPYSSNFHRVLFLGSMDSGEFNWGAVF